MIRFIIMWQETKHGLYKQFIFDDFKQAFNFMTKVSELAESMNHHPRWENEWNVVQIWLSTHAEQMQITDKDKELAEAIDNLGLAHPEEDINPDPKPAGQRKVKTYTDGGSRGNPGPSAGGYVILDLSDNILLDKGVYLGITTNNQAEYTALKLSLEDCLKLEAREVDVYMDSLLVVNQMKGIFKVKNQDLWPIHDDINQLIKKFDKVTFQHVPRELNKLADSAVNRALDEELAKDR